jgi:hypothetical protein
LRSAGVTEPMGGGFEKTVSACGVALTMVVISDPLSCQNSTFRPFRGVFTSLVGHEDVLHGVSALWAETL